MKYLGTRAILFSAIFSLLFLSGMQAQDQAEAVSAASLYNDGLEKAKAKEYVEALSLMEQAIELATKEENDQVIRLAKANGTRAAYGAGVEHRKAKDYDKAMAAFEKGIEFKPDFYTNYVGKAQTLEAQGKMAEAVTGYLKAAEVATSGDKADKADQFEKKTIAIMAKALVDDEFDQTQACAEAYLAVQESPEAHYYLGSALKAKGDLSKAVEHLDKACELAENEEDKSKYYYVKGQTHEALGQTENAIAAFKMVTDAKYKENAEYKVNELGGGR